MSIQFERSPKLGGAKISARPGYRYLPTSIAPDLSRAVQLEFAAKFYLPSVCMNRHDRPSHTHGAAQTRRGLTIRIISILGAPRFSPHRSWVAPHRVAGRSSLEDEDENDCPAIQPL